MVNQATSNDKFIYFLSLTALNIYHLKWKDFYVRQQFFKDFDNFDREPLYISLTPVKIKLNNQENTMKE